MLLFVCLLLVCLLLLLFWLFVCSSSQFVVEVPLTLVSMQFSPIRVPAANPLEVTSRGNPLSDKGGISVEQQHAEG